jgi:transposase
MKSKIQIVHPHAAGIDIGSKSFFVDAGEEEVQVFNTYTEGCNSLRDYLLKMRITTVAMEATGVYWINLYDVLEQSNIEVYLVNGRDVKNLPGRKSDIKDCQWIRELHSFGLLRKSFIPQGDFRVVRSFIRLRQDHIRSSSTQILLMQKALTQMNVRLTEVLNDVTGVSGLRIIQAIVNGERNPAEMLKLCVQDLQNRKGEDILKALEGNFRAEHVFALKQALNTYQYYNQLIYECDKEIEKHLNKMTIDKPNNNSHKKRKPIRYHKPDIENLHEPLLKLTEGKDPVNIAGITDYSFLQIIGEVGVDMSPWSTEKHFTSWLKLAPLKASSGKMLKRISMKRHNNAGSIFRNLASGIINSKHIALGSFGRRIKARRGPGVAIKAVARKIATYFYRVMKYGESFVEQGINKYELMLKERQLLFLEKTAVKHGKILVDKICP